MGINRDRSRGRQRIPRSAGGRLALAGSGGGRGPGGGGVGGWGGRLLQLQAETLDLIVEWGQGAEECEEEEPGEKNPEY
jgi:hypothetical protein